MAIGFRYGIRQGLLTGAFVALIAGVAAAQSVQPALARPGRLVDIGGRRMHLHCTGSGQPTVVFESSFTQFALDWWLVQPAIAKTTRACSYDRATLGWSHPGPHFEHPEQIVSDLHALLQAAGEKPPFVLVSMSMGSFYTRAYQLTHPREVAGMVFVVPAHEDTFLVPIDGKPTPLWALSAAQARADMKRMTEGPRPPPPPVSTGAPFTRLPPEVLQMRIAFEDAAFKLGPIASVENMIVEFESRRVTAAKLHEAGAALGSIPVVVLTGAKGVGPRTNEIHAKIAALSTNSTRRTVPSTDMIHLDHPPAVIDAVNDVVTAVRTKSRIAP